MKITRVYKEGAERFFNDAIMGEKIVSDLKAKGFKIDPKPYIAVLGAKGKTYKVDEEAWAKEEEMRKIADSEGGGEEIQAPKPQKKRVVRKNAKPASE